MKDNSTLRLIGLCLTLGLHPERKEELQQLFTSKSVDLGKLVKAGSDQLVLPAMYLQLKNAALLEYLPDELTEHLDNITQLNRERNQQIMKQVKEISSLLNNNGIQPVFLKGTAHLLLNLYNDPAERMVGDIDFLVPEEKMILVAELLTKLGFDPLIKYKSAIHKTLKHYPRLVNYSYPAAIEIHREVILAPYDKKFNAREILAGKKNVPENPEMFVPSTRHLIIHNMLNAQINDYAYKNRIILLRQMYDLMLLAGKEDPQKALNEFGKCPKLSNAWLAVTSRVLDLPNEIGFDETTSLRSYLRGFFFFQKHPGVTILYRSIVYLLQRTWRYISLSVKAIFNKDVRSGLWARISDPKWYGKHIESYSDYFRPYRKFKEKQD